MTILLLLVLSILIGFTIRYLTKGKQPFQFKLSPFLIGAILSSIVYYVFNFQVVLRDFLSTSSSDWSGGMAAMIIEDGLVAATLYAASLFVLIDMFLLRQKGLNMKYKYLIVTLCTVGAFVFVLFNEFNDISTYHFSPSKWSNHY